MSAHPRAVLLRPMDAFSSPRPVPLALVPSSPALSARTLHQKKQTRVVFLAPSRCRLEEMKCKCGRRVVRLALEAFDLASGLCGMVCGVLFGYASWFRTTILSLLDCRTTPAPMASAQPRLCWQTIPTELQDAITAQCDTATLASVCRLDRSWAVSATRALYTAVELSFERGDVGGSHGRSSACMSALSACPAKAALVLKLVVFVPTFRQDPELRTLLITLAGTLPTLRSLQDLRVRATAWADTLKLHHAMYALLDSRPHTVHTLHIPSSCLHRIAAGLAAENGTLRVLGLYMHGRTTEKDTALLWPLLRAGRVACAYALVLDFSDAIYVFPTFTSSTAWPALFSTVARSCRGELRAGKTLEIEIRLDSPSDATIAVAALAGTSLQPQSLVFVFSADGQSPWRAGWDPVSLAKALVPFAELRLIHFLPSRGDSLTEVECMELALEMRSRGCLQLAYVFYPGGFVHAAG